MKSVNRGFIIGSSLSILGFILLGFGYLNFDTTHDAESHTIRKPPPGFLGGTAKTLRPDCPHGQRFGRRGPRHAACLDLLDRHHPGRVPQ